MIQIKLTVSLAALFCSTLVWAASYQVGPGRAYATLEAALDAVNLEPGDIVEISWRLTAVLSMREA